MKFPSSLYLRFGNSSQSTAIDVYQPGNIGTVAGYKIERRERPSAPWTDVGMAIESEITLSNQERGKEWEYRVIAVNKTGEGLPSNTVMAVV